MIDRSHGGNIWQYPKSSRDNIVDFSVNINPLGMTNSIKDAIARNLDKVNYYPDPESKCIKDKLAKLHGLSSRNFLIGNGSIELIHLIPRALKAVNALIPVPTFSEYEFAAKANGARCLYVKSFGRNNYAIDTARLIRYVPREGIVFLCNPNNPTGRALNKREIMPLLRACERKGATLVIDEAFIDFVSTWENMSMAKESASARRLLVIRSLTKLFVMPGIRAGYAVGHKDTIDKLKRHTYPWNVNSLAQIAAEEAIDNKSYIAKTRRTVSGEREYLYGNLNGIKGVKAYPSCANFLLCKLDGAWIKRASSLSEKLINRGILIRDCGNFRGLDDRFFRIAVKDRKENRKLIKALKDVL